MPRVIKDLDADIIALEEIENENVLKKLNFALSEKAYPYLFFPQKKERSSIESALLSRFPIVAKEYRRWLGPRDRLQGIRRQGGQRQLRYHARNSSTQHAHQGTAGPR